MDPWRIEKDQLPTSLAVNRADHVARRLRHIADDTNLLLKDTVQ